MGARQVAAYKQGTALWTGIPMYSWLVKRYLWLSFVIICGYICDHLWCQRVGPVTHRRLGGADGAVLQRVGTRLGVERPLGARPGLRAAARAVVARWAEVPCEAVAGAGAGLFIAAGSL